MTTRQLGEALVNGVIVHVDLAAATYRFRDKPGRNATEGD